MSLLISYEIIAQYSGVSLLASRLVFEQCLEPPQTFIPFGADFLDPLINIAEGFRGQGIAFFAPPLMDSNQSRIFENMKKCKSQNSVR